MAAERSVSIVSLNTERHTYMKDKIIPFLRERQPEVVLFQDCFERGSNMAADALGIEPIFVAQRRVSDQGKIELQGIATLSRYGFTDQDIFYYVKDGQPDIPMHQEYMHRPGEEVERLRRAALLTGVVKGSDRFRFVNTYFTWTPDGQTSKYQRKDLQILLNYLSIFSELILCGDFNAPRGREIFNKLASVYTDNIPADVPSTLDPKPHSAVRIKGLQLVVDGLFTTPGYRASDIEVISGVSDHCAIAATLARS